MTWYIIAKRQPNMSEHIRGGIINAVEGLLSIFGLAAGDKDPLDVYDPDARLIIKPEDEYPDIASLKPVIDDLEKAHQTTFIVRGDDAEDAVQFAYMKHFLYAGEREALFRQCPPTPRPCP